MTGPAAARPQRRTTRGADKPAEGTQQITVTVGELGTSSRPITGASGMTVGQALDSAGVRAGDRATLVRGRRVNADTRLQDHDIIVVTARVRGGAI